MGTSLGAAAGLAFGVALAGCAARAEDLAPPPFARCEPGDSVLVRDVLYFGRNRPAGGQVTEEDWQRFLDEVVTPRFPAGLTVVRAAGQWRGRTGIIEREPAAVLTLLHAGDQSARRAVTEVAGAYKARFGQEAVLRERAAVCASF